MKKPIASLVLILICILISGCPAGTNPTNDNSEELNASAVILTNLMLISYNMCDGATSPIPGTPSGELSFNINYATDPDTYNLVYTAYDITSNEILYSLTGTAALQKPLSIPLPDGTQTEFIFSGDLEISGPAGMTNAAFDLTYLRVAYTSTNTFTESITGILNGKNINYSASGSIGG